MKWLFRLFLSRFPFSGGRSRRRRRIVPRPRPYRPLLEGLEDRNAPGNLLSIGNAFVSVPPPR